MQYAKVEDERVEATPGTRGACPACRADVIAKCGEIVTWHWAHLSLVDCDVWHSEETAWHRGWKERFPMECREVVRGPHRADVELRVGADPPFVIEFQSKALPLSEMREREDFYGPMAWVFNVREPFERGRLRVFEDLDREFARVVGVPHRAPVMVYQWAHAWQGVTEAGRPVYLDLGDGRVLWVRRHSARAEHAGSCVVLSVADFVAHHTHAARKWCEHLGRRRSA